MNKTVNLFVLAGCWECPDDIGVTVVAVSYTHLDVYKRQVSDSEGGTGKTEHDRQ